ncbi:hypothetical protein L7F22_029698 [Adiantum nelumboides]|nr:hypothetical protein [Adiantum nelumboides]
MTAMMALTYIFRILQRGYSAFSLMAPEVFNQLPHWAVAMRKRIAPGAQSISAAFGLRSLGCNLAHIVQGRPPYRWDKEAYERLARNENPTLPDFASEECQDLGRMCLQATHPHTLLPSSSCSIPSSAPVSCPGH